MITEEKKERLKKFGKNLREIREKRGYSLRSLSHECNIDWSDIGKIERGETDIKLSTLWELADALQVSYAELVTFSTPETT
jgi:transcriptional regulator with XRE-family HTH domain